MVRPQKERRIEQLPPVTHYKPAGIPLRDIKEIILTFEEMEAIRLADVEHLEQARAALRMEISPPTFNRIVNAAHEKIATALWQGYALRVEGGNFRIDHSHHQQELRDFSCRACGYKWSLPHGGGQRCRDIVCPQCGTDEVIRHRDKVAPDNPET